MASKDSVLNGWKEELSQAAEGATKIIAEAAAKATGVIGEAAGKATGVIAEAALSASKALAQSTSSANEQSKVNFKTSAVDHDLLVVLNTKMDNFSIVIKELGERTSARIDILEHDKLNSADSYPRMYKEVVEKRLEFLEKNQHEVIEKRLDLIEKNQMGKDATEKNISDNTNDIKALQLLSVKIMTWGGIIVFLIASVDIVMKFIK